MVEAFNPPDRLSAFSASPFYDKEWLKHVVIFLNGNPLNNPKRLCVEYCISERWVMCCRKNMQGDIIKWNNTVPTFKLSGLVQVFPSDEYQKASITND